MSDQNALIVFQPETPALFSMGEKWAQIKEAALAGSALICRVRTAADNDKAVDAQKEIKRARKLLEDQYKELNRPLLDRQNALRRVIKAEEVELDKEDGRISAVVAAFAEEERERVREAERAQQSEIARIQAEKQAEIDRLAREQAERERIAREAQEAAARKLREQALAAERQERLEREAAEKLAREAKNAAQRKAAEEAAEKLNVQCEIARLAREARTLQADQERVATLAQLEKSSVVTAAAIAKVEATAAAQTYIEAQPVEAIRQKGQVVKEDWEISVTNPYELAKFHPDCVKIEALLTPIKQALNEGRTVKGITAKKVTKSSVRIGQQKFIDV